jgi:hypothetical protein
MRTPPTRPNASNRQQYQQQQQQLIGEQLQMLQLQRRNSGSGGAVAINASPPHVNVSAGYHIPASLHNSRSSSGVISTANWNSSGGNAGGNSYGVMSNLNSNNAGGIGGMSASMGDYAGNSFSISHYNSMLDNSGHNGTSYAINATAAGPWDGGKGLGLMSHQNEVILFFVINKLSITTTALPHFSASEQVFRIALHFTFV